MYHFSAPLDTAAEPQHRRDKLRLVVAGHLSVLFNMHSTHLISTTIELLFDSLSIWAPYTNIERFHLRMGKGYK